MHTRYMSLTLSSSESWEMALLKYFSHDTSLPKQLLSLTQKENEVVSDFVSKAEKEAQHMGVSLCTQSEHYI